MKKHIKAVAGVLALALAFSGGVAIGRENISVTAPITASAETYGAFRYAIEYGEITITGFDKSVRDVVIPSEIVGLPVTRIGNSTFSGCDGITSVTIPDSVTNIGISAFNGCSGLTSVTISNSVTSIGNGAFSGCSGLTSVTIPNSVTSIGEYTFSGCSGFTSVALPDSVASIGNYAFKDCSGLTSVTLPDSVTSIGDYAFYNCRGLTSVTFMNPNCEINGHITYSSNVISSGRDDITIYGYENSTAQKYAEKYGYTFSLIGTAPESPSTADKKGDIDGDGMVNAVDASIIASYYAYLSTTKDEPVMDIDEFMNIQQ